MKKTIIFLIFLAVVLVACERDTRDYAGKAKIPNSGPEYKVTESISDMPGKTNIAEVAPKVAGGPLDGEALYATNCSACHQITGQGVPGAFPPLVGSPYVTGDKTDRMAAIMIYGLMGPINVMGTTYNSAMAPLGALPDEELAAIATYIRSAWGNSAGPVGPEVFKEARAKWGTRSMFQISELGEEK